MEEISNYFVLPVVAIALIAVSFAAPLSGVEAKAHRYSTFDGLRGYLATFVFLHHAATWYYFVHVQEWSYEPTKLYLHFGSTSVALFFMITSFLFISKLADAMGGQVDWLKLHVSRVLRIMPLYLLAIVVLFLLAGMISGFILAVPVRHLLTDAGRWLLFMEPEINGVPGTRYIISGVQWTLAFECLFYCSLPFMALLFFRIKSPLVLFLTAGICMAIFVYVIFTSYPERAWYGIAQFGGGIPAAFLQRSPRVRRFCSRFWMAPILILICYFVLSRYKSILAPLPFLGVTVVFTFIACGNSLFGLLTIRASRLLGQVSYSVYLLHGLLLYCGFKFVLGFPLGRRLTPLGHWVAMTGFCIMLMVLASLSYRWIEQPCINVSGRAAKSLRRRFKKQTGPFGRATEVNQSL